MAQEAAVGWPMLRERIALLCERTITAVREVAARDSLDLATSDRVAALLHERATAMLLRLRSDPMAPGRPDTTS
jgi:hypothetical protein